MSVANVSGLKAYKIKNAVFIFYNALRKITY